MRLDVKSEIETVNCKSKSFKLFINIFNYELRYWDIIFLTCILKEWYSYPMQSILWYLEPLWIYVRLYVTKLLRHMWVTCAIFRCIRLRVKVTKEGKVIKNKYLFLKVWEILRLHPHNFQLLTITPGWYYVLGFLQERSYIFFSFKN